METLEEKVRRVTAESVEVVPYNPAWPGLYEAERLHLLSCMPHGLIVRIEHFGSTAVPGLAAKPIVDMVIEVADVQKAKVAVPRIPGIAARWTVRKRSKASAEPKTASMSRSNSPVM